MRFEIYFFDVLVCSNEKILKSETPLRLEGRYHYEGWMLTAQRSKVTTAPTLIGSCKFIREHRVDNGFYVRGMRVTRTVVNLCFSRDVIGCVARLKDIQGPPHITLGELEQSPLPIFSQLYTKQILLSELSSYKMYSHTYFSASITPFSLFSTSLIGRGENRKRVHRLCMAGIILFT